MKTKLFITMLALVSSLPAFGQHPQATCSYLEIYDVETGSHRIVKEFPYVVEAPNWTPDGKWLVVNKGGRLFKLAADGSTDLQEIPTGRKWSTWPITTMKWSLANTSPTATSS